MSSRLLLKNLTSGRNRYPYNPEEGTRFDRDSYTFEWEESPFWKHVLPVDYIEFTSDSPVGKEEADKLNGSLMTIARYGVNARGVHYSFLYGHMMDHADVTVVPSSAGLTLDKLGIHVHDVAKLAKPFKRVKAPHKAVVFGRTLDVVEVPDGRLVHFRLEDGYQGVMRVVDLKYLDDRRTAIADGQARIGTDFYRHVGRINGMRVRDWTTYAGKYTGFSPAGVVKGYGHSQPDLKYDIVAYGAKESVSYDDFFFGIMSDLNPGRVARTDMQSLVNFELHDFLPDVFRDLRDSITERLSDRDRVLSFFLDLDAKMIKQEGAREWMLPKIVTMGIDPMAEPSVFRRLTRHYMNNIVEVEEGRIPWDQKARRADIVPDPHMFDQWGDIHPENTVIPEGAMVFMDVPEGPTAEYRQPNGHALEHSRSRNIHLREFDKYLGMQRSFYGADLLEKNAPKNGADNDDPQTVVFDPDVVRHFYGLTYNVGKKYTSGGAVMSAVRDTLTLSKLAKSVGRVFETTTFDADAFVKTLSTYGQSQTQLGALVNTIMLDMSLSGPNKQSMLKDLTERIANEPDGDYRDVLRSKREWLIHREDNQARDLATNLEGNIDYAVQGKGDPNIYGPMQVTARKIRTEAEVYPEFFAQVRRVGAVGRSRISPTAVLNVDYVLAKSLLDRALDVISVERDNYRDALRRWEWDCITPVPEDVEMMYGADPTFTKTDTASALSWWNEKMVALSNVTNPDLAKKMYGWALWGKQHICTSQGKDACPKDCPLFGTIVEDGLVQFLNKQYDEETLNFLVVDLKRVTQRSVAPTVDRDTGLYRSVSDSAFGNDYIFGIYLNILDKANLTGRYMRVEYDQTSRSYLDRVMTVRIEEGAVYDPTNGDYIGDVGDKTIDGDDYKMFYGYIEIGSPDKSITRDADRFGVVGSTRAMDVDLVMEKAEDMGNDDALESDDLLDSEDLNS